MLWLEKQRKRKAKAKDAWTKHDRFLAFKNESKDGLVYQCVSCNRALWKSQVEILFEKQINTLANKCGKAFLEEKILMGQKIEDLKHIVFCTTCVRYVRKKEPQIPKIHVSNGLELDEQCENVAGSNPRQIQQSTLFRELVGVFTTHDTELTGWDLFHVHQLQETMA